MDATPTIALDDRTLRGKLLALNLPTGAAVNAEALILDYGYPFDAAVARAVAWCEHSERISALGY